MGMILPFFLTLSPASLVMMNGVGSWVRTWKAVSGSNGRGIGINIFRDSEKRLNLWGILVLALSVAAIFFIFMDTKKVEGALLKSTIVTKHWYLAIAFAFLGCF